jgi:hypothetical protein
MRDSCRDFHIPAEISFGDGTRGTNDYKDYPISFIVGNPYYGSDYFLNPAFEKVWKSDAVFEEEKKKDRYAFRVEREISKSEARINLIQMIGRNLRDSSDNPNSVKVVVVFSDIDFTKECKEQNGGVVIPLDIRREIKIFQGKEKGEAKVIDAFRKACQVALRPQIWKGIEERIDGMLKENPNVPIQLQTVATMLQNQINLYGVEGIKKYIKSRYETINDDRIVNGKTIPVAFIIRKKTV